MKNLEMPILFTYIQKMFCYNSTYTYAEKNLSFDIHNYTFVKNNDKL